MNYRETLKINNRNHLEISGCDCVDLVKTYGTPLYVMDVSYIKQVIEAYKAAIKEDYDNMGNVAFASKAFSTTAIYTIMKSLNACIDVVSEGEMFTAKNAGFNLNNAYFHGNNKLISELEYAVKNNIGTIVVDNEIDLERIDGIAKQYNRVQDVLVRINPGVEAHTHNFIQTSKIDSKFGFSILSNDATNVITKIFDYKNLHFKGIHSHIGSQIFDIKGFELAVDKISDFMKILRDKYNILVEEVNFGGGFGIHYTKEDPNLTIDNYTKYIKTIIARFKKNISENNFKSPHIMFEPGRSIVGEAGITLYTATSIKEIKNVIKYINIDGGMHDNIRPALYDAKYEAIIANRASDALEETVSIAGKCCESGDIILKNIQLPKVKIGDIIAVMSTGAYNYSMASNYNRNLIPPVVFVEDGKHGYAVKPQSNQDLIRNDIVPEWI